MRRFTIGLILLFVAWLNLSAQVISYYELNVSNTEYVPVDNLVSVLPSSDDGNFNGLVFDDKGAQSGKLEGSGFDVGFKFKYNNDEFSRFAIAANGYVLLGKDDGITYDVPSSYSIDYVLSSNSNVFGVTLGCELSRGENTAVGYVLAGDEGNRTLTIEYRNLQVTSYGDVVASVSLQYILHESNGNIDFKFKDFAPKEGTYMRSQNLRIGLAGNTGDVLYKDGTFADDAVSSNGYGISWSSYSYPENGLTYTWSKPKDCETPTAQPTDLNLERTSNTISGTFKAQAEGDHYLVLLSKSDKLDTLPVDGTTYNANDEIGDMRVVGYFTDGSNFNITDLDGATTYYVYVLAANSSCLGGPKYNTVSPLSGNITTLPVAPEAIDVTDVDSNWMQYTVQPNAGNEPVLVAMTDKYCTTGSGSLDTNPKFGIPSGEYSVGDKITDGGTIVYKGTAGEQLKLSDLDENTIYHLRAWTIGKNGEYSSTSATASTVTAAKMPWTANLSRYPLQVAPAGWHFDNTKWVVAKNTSWGATDTTPYLENVDIETDGTKTVESWVETPDIYLANTANRLIFALQMSEYKSYSKSILNFGDSDEMLVQVTTDGKQYTTVKTYNKENMPAFADADTYNKFYVTFYEAAGKKARVRVLFRFGDNHNNVNIRMRDISLEEKGSCDYPVNLSAVESSIVGSEATVKWESQGDENAWEIRYKKAEDSSWGAPVVVRDNPYTIKGLDGLTDYEVQVRALCSETEHSKWSEKASFKSGLAVPFTEDFTKEKEEPSGWTAKTGNLASPSVLTDGGNWKFNAGYWETNVVYTSYDDSNSDWYVSPLFDLGDGTTTYKATFDIKSGYSRSEHASLSLVIAADGENFNEKDVVLKKEDADIATGTYTAELNGYSGKIRLALLFTHDGGSYSNLVLNSVSVQPSSTTAIASSSATTGAVWMNGNILKVESNDSNIREVQVYDASGRMLQRVKAMGSELQVPLTAKGVVVVRIVTATGCRVMSFNVK